MMVRKKIFPTVLIETKATEESYFPSQHRLSDPTWNRKKKGCAGRKERFFVGQWSAKAMLSQQMQKPSF
jgi:hypothetical protein